MTARPQRILFVDTNHDGTFGGSHQAMFDLIRHIDRDKYTPIALFYEHNSFVDRLRTHGIRVMAWDDQWKSEHGTYARWFWPRRLVGIVLAIARRAAFLRREQVDLVHLNNSPSYAYHDWLPAARLVGVPCITHLRGQLYPVNNRLVHWLNCRFDRYIAISSYVRQILENANFPREKILQIEDGVDVDAIRASLTQTRSQMRASLGMTPGKLLGVMAGHLRTWKGHDVVIKALAALTPELRSRIHIVFAGADDPRDLAFRQQLDELVRIHALQDCVRFLGYRADVPDLMNAADLVLHASTDPEPFGLVVLEGMVFGRLVIASALGGPLQIVREGSGWTFHPGHPLELTELLRRVIENPELADKHATAAIARAEAFTVQRTAMRVQKVYQELLG